MFLAVFSPLAAVSGAVSAGILRLFGIKSTNKADSVTEQEILMMVDAVNETGGIGEVTVVVTRYFGGILLGTGGLVKAYQSSVKMALEAVPTRIRTKTKRIKFSVEHRFVNQVLRKIETANGRILEKNFDMDADFDVEIPEDLAETFAKELEELTRGALLIEFVEE